jgi:hypothetical protein
MVTQRDQWFDDNADNTPWLKALEDVRRRATREGWCYQHVQAIIVRSTSTRKRPRATGSIF